MQALLVPLVELQFLCTINLVKDEIIYDVRYEIIVKNARAEYDDYFADSFTYGSFYGY